MPKFHTLPIVDRRRETDDCISYAFGVPPELEAGFSYRAGQYLTLRTRIDGEEVRRAYSLCSAPYEREWRVAIKRVRAGKFSNYAAEHLPVGATLDVMPPAGSFEAPSGKIREIVCFAAGSGITPILGILKSVLHSDPQAKATLFYGNRTTRSIIFSEELTGLKNVHLQRFQLHHVLSAEDLGAELFFGRLDEARCAAFAKTFFDPERVNDFYLCGPEPMIRAISKALEARGVPTEKIHFELFGAPRPPTSAETTRSTSAASIRRQAESSRVAITYDGKTVSIDMLDDGAHLLEAALAYGLDLPYACKGGVCSTCKCRVTKGEVTMDLNYALEPDEVAEGFVLSCQSRPLTEEVAVDFDA